VLLNKEADRTLVHSYDVEWRGVLVALLVFLCSFCHPVKQAYSISTSYTKAETKMTIKKTIGLDVSLNACFIP